MIVIVLSSIGMFACSEQTDTREIDKVSETGLPVYPVPDRTTIPAFPGAEGAGKYTTGGAEGTVYVVTWL